MLIYLYGGVYVLGSVWGYCGLVVQFVVVVGMMVLVFDYICVLYVYYLVVFEEMVVVYICLFDDGFDLKMIVIVGDLVGGGLILVLVMVLCDCGIQVLVVFGLICLWVDFVVDIEVM